MKWNKFSPRYLLSFLLIITGAFLVYKGEPLPKKKAKRSLSDNPPYIAAILEALSSPQSFASFKRHPILNLLQEYNTFEEGQDYAIFLYTRFPHFLPKLDKIRRNDRFGEPKKYNFPFVGEFSPTTLRYAKAAADIEELYGSLEGKHIIEIGGGYGGQCKVLSELHNFKSYTIIDIEPSLSLCKKYVEANQIQNVRFLSLEELPHHRDLRCDLVISHFGLSQYERGIQKFLIKNILRKASAGYIACAFHPKHYGVKSLPKHELIARIQSGIKELREIPEEPLTAKNNCILTWKK